MHFYLTNFQPADPKPFRRITRSMSKKAADETARTNRELKIFEDLDKIKKEYVDCTHVEPEDVMREPKLRSLCFSRANKKMEKTYVVSPNMLIPHESSVRIVDELKAQERKKI